MKLIEHLTKMLAESEYGRRIEDALKTATVAEAQAVDQQRIARRRRLILDALDRQGLTKADGEKLLSWAEPGTLTSDEALALVRVLRVAAGNARQGRGLLKEEIEQATFAQKAGLWLSHMSLLHGVETPPEKRLQEIKKTTWWPEVVEAMYRAELTAAQTNGQLHYTPSEASEGRVGRAVGISGASVHAICNQVRQGRKASGEEPVDPIPVQRFERWLAEGGLLFSEQS